MVSDEIVVEYTSPLLLFPGGGGAGGGGGGDGRGRRDHYFKLFILMHYWTLFF